MSEIQDSYASYVHLRSSEIRDLLANSKCRPVLFIGSGFSIRYSNGPTWHELLSEIAKAIGLSDQDYSFLRQSNEHDPVRIGSALAEAVFAWAWEGGRNNFPQEFFESAVDKEIYIKYLTSKIIDSMTKTITNDPKLTEEIDLFAKIFPHAIITTNFDSLVNQIYSEYDIVVGERLLRDPMNTIGDIFQVHGSSIFPASLVLTEKDYKMFANRRKYITSKLMTYFAEFPVFIFGYNLADENIRTIISDLGEAAIDIDGFFENIYFVQWREKIEKSSDLRTEYAVSTESSATNDVRIKALTTTDFKWIFEILSESVPANGIKIGLMRKLVKQFHHLVADRISIPQQDTNFDVITKLVNDETEFSRILGFGTISSTDLAYPYTISMVATKLGFTYWGRLTSALDRVDPNFISNVKKNDDEFHQFVSTGKSGVHKYSSAFVQHVRELLRSTLPLP